MKVDGTLCTVQSVHGTVSTVRGYLSGRTAKCLRLEGSEGAVIGNCWMLLTVQYNKLFIFWHRRRRIARIAQIARIATVNIRNKAREGEKGEALNLITSRLCSTEGRPEGKGKVILNWLVLESKQIGKVQKRGRGETI